MKSRSAPCFLRARGGAAQAIAAERADERTGHDADAAMAEAVEMVHRLGRRLGVVDVHARNAEARAELAAVDDRRAARAAHQRRARGFFRQPMAEKDQAVGFLPLQHHRVALFALLVVLRVADAARSSPRAAPRLRCPAE